MKPYLTVILVVISVLLAVALVMTKRSDSADLDLASISIADFSNRLDTATLQVNIAQGGILNLSNLLVEATSASVTFSNQLTDAQSTNTVQADQITSLTRQLADITAADQALSADLLNATNQLTALRAQFAQSQTSLAQTTADYAQFRKDYALLQNRFERDVAERTLLARKFNNLAELQSQMEKLYLNPADQVAPADFYKGLDVEVRSNGIAHVIAPE
jgi:chromosome segregation ATPase